MITIMPMIRIEFSKYGAFAEKHWPSGKVDPMNVSVALKELARLSPPRGARRDSGNSQYGLR